MAILFGKNLAGNCSPEERNKYLQAQKQEKYWGWQAAFSMLKDLN